MKSFEVIYGEVRPIVLRLRKSYHIRLWAPDDWDQEARISLFLLIQEHPELLGSKQLYTYFKTKMVNRVKDEIRKQESLKRQFNKMAYEEIGEVGYKIPSRAIDMAEYITFRDKIREMRKVLKGEELDKLEALMAGECFKGKAAFMRELKLRFGD